jgi:hypothetical protein
MTNTKLVASPTSEDRARVGSDAQPGGHGLVADGGIDGQHGDRDGDAPDDIGDGCHHRAAVDASNDPRGPGGGGVFHGAMRSMS